MLGKNVPSENALIRASDGIGTTVMWGPIFVLFF